MGSADGINGFLLLLDVVALLLIVILFVPTAGGSIIFIGWYFLSIPLHLILCFAGKKRSTTSYSTSTSSYNNNNNSASKAAAREMRQEFANQFMENLSQNYSDSCNNNGYEWGVVN